MFSPLFFEKWNENRIAWHENDPHEALLRFGDLIIPSSEETKDDDLGVCSASGAAARVLVPLCGKSVDMAYLARRAGEENGGVTQVVGVDGILKPLEIFASEHPDLEITTQAEGRLSGKNVLLLQSDFFHLDEATTAGLFDAVFDRASLVAIDPSLREAYVKVVQRLLKPGGRILLAVIERLEGDPSAGPPFSVSEQQVRELYGPDWIESIHLLEDNGEKERNKERDMRSLFFLIESKRSM